MVDRMRANPNHRPREPHGVWLPPRRRGGNQRRTGSTTDVLYYYDGDQQRLLPVPGVEPETLGLVLYKEASVYHDHCRFWAVPYDAINNQVGDGSDGGHSTHQASSNAGAGNANGAHNVWDWRNIGFIYGNALSNVGASYVHWAGVEPRLRYMRVEQRWPHELFPHPFQPPMLVNVTNTTPRPYLGGLIGDLPIIIALIAFSRPPEEVHDALEQTMSGPEWMPQVERIGQGWSSKRGMHVRVWSGAVLDAGFAADANEIAAFEEGGFGRIFD